MMLFLFKAVAQNIFCKYVQEICCFVFTSFTNTQLLPWSMDLIYGKEKKSQGARSDK